MCANTIHAVASKNIYFPGILLVLGALYFVFKKMEATDYAKIRFLREGVTLTTRETFTLKEEALTFSHQEVSSIEPYNFILGQQKGITVFLSDRSSSFSINLIEKGRYGPFIRHRINTNQKFLLDYLEKVGFSNSDLYYNFKFVTHLTDELKEFGYVIKLR